MKRFALLALALSMIPAMASEAEAGRLRSRGGGEGRILHRQRGGEGQRIFHWPRLRGARHCGG